MTGAWGMTLGGWIWMGVGIVALLVMVWLAVGGWRREERDDPLEDGNAVGDDDVEGVGRGRGSLELRPPLVSGQQFGVVDRRRLAPKVEADDRRSRRLAEQSGLGTGSLSGTGIQAEQAIARLSGHCRATRVRLLTAYCDSGAN